MALEKTFVPHTFHHITDLRLKVRNLWLKSKQDPVAFLSEFELLAAELGSSDDPMHEITALTAFLTAIARATNGGTEAVSLPQTRVIIKRSKRESVPATM